MTNLRAKRNELERRDNRQARVEHQRAPIHHSTVVVRRPRTGIKAVTGRQ